MTGFSAEWLALREPADTRARDAELSAQLARLAPQPLLAPGSEAAPPPAEVTQRAPLPAQVTHRAPPPAQGTQRSLPRSSARFIDLACGTGANLRYLAPRMSGDQHWLLVDNDDALLAKAQACAADYAVAAKGCRVETRRLDLTTGLNTLRFAPGVVVTASALLDLVSGEWLALLVEQCRVNRCTALFALSYDGRMTFTPSEPDDEWVRQLVNRHQLSDKGFGPALGPTASKRACEQFSKAGFHVRTARSDWNLLPAEHLLQQALLEGWASAATELAPTEADRCTRWLTRRLAHVANRTSHIVVGHEDVLAWPREPAVAAP